MAIKKGLLKKLSSAPDGVYPYTQTDCVFDEITGNSLDAMLTPGNGIVIDQNGIKNQFQELVGVDANSIKYNYMGYVRNATNAPATNGLLISCAGVANYQTFQIFRALGTSKEYAYTRIYNKGDNVWSKWSMISYHYTTGDTITISASNPVSCIGMASSATRVYFSVPLSRPINASSITLSSLKIYVRSSSGAVLGTTEVVGSSTYTIQSIAITENGLLISVNGLTGLTAQAMYQVSVSLTGTFA